MNIDKINKLADLLDGLPEDNTFDMGDYFHPCGTPSCIAGWALHLEGKHRNDFLSPIDSELGFYEVVFDKAMEVLGLEYLQADALFTPSSRSFPEDRRDEYWKTPVSAYNITNKDAAHILRKLAKTGEVDFSIILDGDKV